ncbi:MAG: flagellar hook-basal body complex protein [Syntrophales bacterium]|nr:flagellar hook-basal body complex protein [Syntrophales bacterium]
MSTAISIGTTGLTASSKQMDVIGNNLANSNTLGFKASNTYFASMLNQSLSSGGALQVGSGVAVAAIGTQFQQGAFETTGSATDLAIDGEGFFIVQDPEGGVYYTRAGNFHISKEGYLVDTNDYKVLGYCRTTTGSQADTITPISLKNVQSVPQATTQVSMGINLNDATSKGEKFTVSQTVYDSKGAQHNLSTIYQKTKQPGTWGFTVKLDDVEGEVEYHGVVFDDDGNLKKIYKGAMSVITSTQDKKVVVESVNYGQIYPASGTVKVAYDGNNWTITNKGGFPSATLDTSEAGKIKVNLDGSGENELTFEINDITKWAADDYFTFNISNDGRILNKSVTSKEGLITSKNEVVSTDSWASTSNIKLKYTGNTWAKESAGCYDGMTVSYQDYKIFIDLDGSGGADIILSLKDSKDLWTANDTIEFTLTSTVASVADLDLTFADLANGAIIGDNNKVTWQLKTDTINKLTGYSSASVVQSLSANGYPSGVLKSLSFGKDGTITGFFTNGQTSELGCVLLANFPNPGGLKKVGNYFASTIESGTAIINIAGTGGLGEVISNTLELSNVDTAKEFINMIQAQRAYQASARVITTANEMLTELMNIKR